MFENIFTLFFGIIIGVAICLFIHALTTFNYLTMGNKIYAELVRRGVVKPKPKPKDVRCENGHIIKDFQLFHGCPICLKNEKANKNFKV